jgi:hypothetical protein
MTYGSPQDVAGECNARLYIGDDYGDNRATMRCQREPGHEGKHREVYKTRDSGEVTIEWERDGRLAEGEPETVEDLMKPIVEDDD